MFRPLASSVCRFVLVLLGPAVLIGASSASAQDAIIIDHTCTDISQIPDVWVEHVKQTVTFHYAHTSHGSQIISGAALLEQVDTRFSIAVRTSGTEGLPAIENPPAVRIYDGNPPETYIEPNDYWDGTAAMNRTRAVAGTGRYLFSMWSWCGQQSSNSAATTQRYLDALNQLEGEYPGMRFIYMTGHTDGTGEAGNLNQRNNQVRDYCRTHGKVLFDFADIESYDPDGNYYLNRSCNDNCDYNGGNWADQWCAAHPGHVLCLSCSCAHSKPLNCNRKARAYWWMLARLAGWPGPSSTPAADLDGDGDVDGADFGVFAGCFNGTGNVVSGACLEADLTGDHCVDGIDYGIFASCFNGSGNQPLCS